MRIKGVRLASGLAVALVGVAAEKAFAADVTISTATTTPLETSAPDGNSPGNVSITSAGSITIDEGETAVTVNSNNNVTNSGLIASEDADNTTGILIEGGFTGTINNEGRINLLEDYTLEDDDDDGNVDGPWAEGEGRNGIWLQSGPTHTGNILTSNTSSITVEGANSAGIRLDALLTGNLTSNGAISVAGDNGRGIAINEGVTGDVNITGTLNLRGENSVAVEINGALQGALNINGTHSISGYHSTSRPSAERIEDFDPDDLLQSGGFLELHYSVAEGVTLQGTGVEDDEDDDGDGDTEEEGDTNDDVSTNITVYSGAPAIWIAPDAAAPQALVLGNTGRGYGFVNRGTVAANGVYDGFDTTTIRVEGAGGATTTLFGGLLNDGTLTTLAAEAESYGIYVGDDAIVPTIVNRKAISTRTVAETMQTSYGVFIGSGANVGSLSNSGIISAQLLGEVGDAVAIIDQSNTLATITNTGTIQSQVLATDNDLTDDVFPEVTGNSVAIDVSASTIGVTVNQLEDTEFNDDDDEDDDENARPPVRIVGDVRFGSGADTLNVQEGFVIGGISFGAGADTLIIDNDASVIGSITDSDGLLSIDVIDGQLGIGRGTLNITTAHFGEDAELGVVLSPTAGESTVIIASGTVTFDEGAIINPVIPAGLPETGSHIFLTANGGLIGGENVERVVTGEGSPFIYNTSVAIADSDANSLEASYVLKTTQELGLNINETAAFSPILTALRTNDDASQAFANLTTEDEFFDAYGDLLPNYAGAAAELAATAIQQGQSATTNRLATTRLQEIEEVSVWAQEIGYGLTREPEDYGVEYRGSGFGFAFGIDGPLNSGGLFGLSASFIASEVEEPGRVDGELAASIGQLNAYLGTAMGPVDLDFVVGGGVGQMRSRRVVAIGEDFEETAEAEWMGYEGHGAVRASAPMRSGRFIVTPQAALSYVYLAEEGYTEEGGGSAIDYEIDETTSQRLWGDVGVEFATRFGRAGATQLMPRAFVGYRANLIDEAAERDVRFVSGPDTEFTLIDETTGSGGALVGLGFDATNGYSTFSLSYEGEYGDQLTRHSLNAALRFRF